MSDQFVAGQLNCIKRGGTGCIEGEAITAKAKRPGKQTGRQTSYLTAKIMAVVKCFERKKGPWILGIAKKGLLNNRPQQPGRNPRGGIRGKRDSRQNHARPLAVQGFKGGNGLAADVQDHVVKRVELLQQVSGNIESGGVKGK